MECNLPPNHVSGKQNLWRQDGKEYMFPGRCSGSCGPNVMGASQEQPLSTSDAGEWLMDSMVGRQEAVTWVAPILGAAASCGSLSLFPAPALLSHSPASTQPSTCGSRHCPHGPTWPSQGCVWPLFLSLGLILTPTHAQTDIPAITDQEKRLLWVSEGLRLHKDERKCLQVAQGVV